MIIQPVNFVIPPDVAAGLASGDLLRFGGVVRDPLGKVVVHLKEVPALEKAPQALQRFTSILKENRLAFALGTGIVVVSATAAAGMAAWRWRQLQLVVDRYSSALGVYLSGVRDASLQQGDIDGLLRALDAVTEHSVAERLQINWENREAVALVGLVTDFSRALAEVNGAESPSLKIVPAKEDRDPISTLRRNLEYQRRMFGETV